MALKNYDLQFYDFIKWVYKICSLLARSFALGGAVHELTKSSFEPGAGESIANYYSLPIATAFFGLYFEAVCQGVIPVDKLRKFKWFKGWRSRHEFKVLYHRHFEALYEVILSAGVLSAITSIFLRDANSFIRSDVGLSVAWSLIDGVFELLVFPATFLRFLDEYLKPSFSFLAQGEFQFNTEAPLKSACQFVEKVFTSPFVGLAKCFAWPFQQCREKQSGPDTAKPSSSDVRKSYKALTSSKQTIYGSTNFNQSDQVSTIQPESSSSIN